MAAAQTSPPAERPLHIELDSPPGVLVRIRPYLGAGQVAEFVTCPPFCKLAGYGGYYQLEADPPPDSGLRRLRKTVQILADSRIFVAPGERVDRHLGVGLTVSGGIVLGLGIVVSLFAGGIGADLDDDLTITGLSMMGVGAAATAGGIYFLVRSRGRVTLDPAWQAPVVPPPPPTESHLDVGWRF